MTIKNSKMDPIVAHFFKPGDSEAMKRFCAFSDALEEGMGKNPGIRSFIGGMVTGGVTRLMRDQVIPSMERQGL